MGEKTAEIREKHLKNFKELAPPLKGNEKALLETYFEAYKRIKEALKLLPPEENNITESKASTFSEF